MDERRKGFLLGVAAYALWGLFPLYWPLLEPAGAVELLAHRVTWSALVMVLLVVLLRRGRRVRAMLRSARTRWLLMLAAVLISVNWGMFIYGVNSGQVVEVSLGYFINPLVTVLAGVLVLGERLRRTQWLALAIAAAAVTGLTLALGSPPWIALTLAFSFAGYGLVRKKADVGAVEGLTVETLLVVPLALGYLWWLGAAGQAQSLEDWPWHLLLLTTSGLVTALPLICFGGAATRVPLTTLGLLQYGTPTLHFVIGVFLYGEEMPTARWLAFAAIWLALALFTLDSVRHRRRRVPGDRLSELQVGASGA
ncbi:EamA family transporter RarD [Nocardioides sp. HDW12B]|uniref:EamA family transporter RarD n=1 Tax=Nocardioides sp. HDW12B TaxID=2714939 RepID=UPI001408AD88|nr:EamA family transporter RarD [Nocardioides sp. HDW12B]QIK65164.1 EamA family transporter RarD [Nocardioides sp. HDW12B]